jgi:hypothetical protein
VPRRCHTLCIWRHAAGFGQQGLKARAHFFDVVARRVLGVGQAVQVVDAGLAHCSHDELEGDLHKTPHIATTTTKRTRQLHKALSKFEPHKSKAVQGAGNRHT